MPKAIHCFAVLGTQSVVLSKILLALVAEVLLFFLFVSLIVFLVVVLIVLLLIFHYCFTSLIWFTRIVFLLLRHIILEVLGSKPAFLQGRKSFPLFAKYPFEGIGAGK